jgi:hypothetical protein
MRSIALLARLGLATLLPTTLLPTTLLPTTFLAAAFLSTALPTLLLAACETDLPVPTDAAPHDGGSGPDGGRDEAGLGDGGLDDAGLDDGGPIDAGDAAPLLCEPAEDDYTPRIAMSSTDSWPPCVSDDGVFHVIDAPGLSSQARVAAFESIFAATELAYVGRDPASGDFTSARTTYAEPNGLGSRVNRRTDEHYAPVSGSCTSGATALSGCQCPDVAAASPEYCVGPGTLLPIIQRAFRAGQLGDAEPPRVHAARIHAALLWFLYVSPYKEALSCASGDTAKDCDSAWAYYTGQDASSAADRGAGIGLSAIVRALEPETHDRIWDGLLAVRCWRDLDRGAPLGGAPFGDATMPELRDRARAQLDRAMLRGIVAIAIARLGDLEAATGDDRAAHLAFLETWLRPIAATTLEVIDETSGTVTASYPVGARPSLLDRALREASPAGADFIAEQMSGPSPLDVDGIIAALESAFPCP